MPATLAEYLNQGEIWLAKNGPFPIDEMEMTYRRRTLHWLSRNCAEIFRYYTLERFVDGDQAPTLETMIRWIDARPSNWIKTTALYQALAKGTPEELNR